MARSLLFALVIAVMAVFVCVDASINNIQQSFLRSVGFEPKATGVSPRNNFAQFLASWSASQAQAKEAAKAKFSTTTAAVKDANVVTPAATLSSWTLLNSCDGSGAIAIPLNYCQPYSILGYIAYTVSNGQPYTNFYTDSACATTPYLTYSLSSLVTFGSSCSGGVQLSVSAPSSSLPAVPSGGAVVETYYVNAGCTGTWGFLTGPTGKCIDFSGSAGTVTCSGNTYSATIYSSSTTCSGSSTPYSGTFPSCTTFASQSSSPTYGSPLPGSAQVASAAYADGALSFTDTCQTAPAAAASTCFAGSESIMLESGATVPISDVRVGDKVLAYSSASQSTVFSDVVAVPHGQNNIKADFQHIAMESGADIKMTAEHLLPAGACSLASLPLARAADVQVGDCVQTTEGVSRVVSNNVVSDEGIYTIVTNADFVVVNGVVASPFAVNHAVANFMYGIHRMVYAVAPKMVAPVSGVMSNLAAYFTK